MPGAFSTQPVAPSFFLIQSSFSESNDRLKDIKAIDLIIRLSMLLEEREKSRLETPYSAVSISEEEDMELCYPF